MLKDLIGKEIQLYPGDTVSKWGVIEEINEYGFLVRITRVNKGSDSYAVGDVHFIAHSSGFHFRVFRGAADSSKYVEIGKAVEKAFETQYEPSNETVLLISASSEECGYSGYKTLRSTDDLVKWSKQGGI